MGKIQHLTEASFDAAVSQPGLLVLDFWAGWCGPCQAMAPQLEQASQVRPWADRLVEALDRPSEARGDAALARVAA